MMVQSAFSRDMCAKSWRVEGLEEPARCGYSQGLESLGRIRIVQFLQVQGDCPDNIHMEILHVGSPQHSSDLEASKSSEIIVIGKFEFVNEYIY